MRITDERDRQVEAVSVSAPDAATARHTPGPWKSVTAGNVREVISSGGKLIADVVVDGPDGVANSYLLAAAPELRDALKRLQGAIVERDLWHGQEDELDAATRAIAKAEGCL